VEVRGQVQASAALPCGKQCLPFLGRRLGWAPERVWTAWRRVKYLSVELNWDFAFVVTLGCQC
jgi:hypothetical protein